MKILHILGNGFDINLGLPTEYSEFYEYYDKQSSNSESIHKLKKHINQNFKNWADLELALGKYSSKVETENEFDLIIDDIRDNLAEYLHMVENKFDPSTINVEPFLKDLEIKRSLY